MIYLDNNATTNISQQVCQQIVAWSNMGNPSASYSSARRCQKMMLSFKKEIANYCDFDWNCDAALNPRQYYIIFTSGASESNSMVITRVIDAYIASGAGTPYIVCAAIEHKSIIEALKYHIEMKRCEVAFINPLSTGVIDPTAIEAAIKPNTALVCCMTANNEMGAMNDVSKIAAIAHAHKVPFYTDAVQSFGKYGIQPVRDGIDGFCVSFHKMGGPTGCGLLVLKREWVEGYGIKALIFGTQNSGMRGGTENIPAIAGSRAAFTTTICDRAAKNKRLAALKEFICTGIMKRAPWRTYDQYLETINPNSKIILPEVEIIFFDCSYAKYSNIEGNDRVKACSARYLPNTIFLAIVKRTQPPMCNTRFKEMLEKHKIIISVGSACNTQSSKASHVLYALGADDFIRKGALRITLGDHNTKEECCKFVKAFIEILSGCVAQNHLTK